MIRISGLSGSGLDIDSIVKDSMKAYQVKIDQTTQKKNVVEIKQKLYRDVIKDNRDFYNKYLDISKGDSLLKAANWGVLAFSSGDSDAVTAKATGEAINDTYTVTVNQLATKATTTLKNENIIQGGSITVAGVPINNITADEKASPALLAERINKELVTANKAINASYSEVSGGIIFQSTTMGAKIGTANNEFVVLSSNGISSTAKGTDSSVTIKNSTGGSVTKTSASNSVSVDGITFNVNEKCTDVKITGKPDAKELKNRIVDFINSYNTNIVKLNTTIMTKHDRSYTPLTADQKKEMSETEVKLWNEKVEAGQLYKDSDVQRIADSMKEAMRTVMEGTGLNLEDIGIKPVKDYSGTLNGTYKVEDEEKLQRALEENTEGVMNLFIANPTTKTENNTGILQKLSSTLDKEVMKSTSSPLLKKAGYEGTLTVANNELTKSISDYEKKIKDMQTNFSRKEQELYTKYSSLEKMLSQYSSQQSSLASMLGTN